MSRTTANIPMKVEGGFTLSTIEGVEAIADVVIHRTICGNKEDGFAATGKGWVVSLKVSGLALVSDIGTRAQVRAIGRRLAPAVEAFKQAVHAERRNAYSTRLSY